MVTMHLNRVSVEKNTVNHMTQSRVDISHTSNSCECMGVNGEALQLHAVRENNSHALHLNVQ